MYKNQDNTTSGSTSPGAAASAVSYLRVSTKEQAEKGGMDEGYSIPAQRDANLRKAESIGARVVGEFVDAGESARTADRPDLMRMIQYVQTHKVSYCIVHKVDRLARNRADDVAIHLALRDARRHAGLGDREHRRDAVRHVVARDHVDDCGVLLPKPRH